MIEIYPLSENIYKDFLRYSGFREVNIANTAVMVAFLDKAIVGYVACDIKGNVGVITHFYIEDKWVEFEELLGKSIMFHLELRGVEKVAVKNEGLFYIAEKIGLKKENGYYAGNVKDRFCGR